MEAFECSLNQFSYPSKIELISLAKHSRCLAYEQIIWKKGNKCGMSKCIVVSQKGVLIKEMEGNERCLKTQEDIAT